MVQSLKIIDMMFSIQTHYAPVLGQVALSCQVTASLNPTLQSLSSLYLPRPLQQHEPGSTRGEGKSQERKPNKGRGGRLLYMNQEIFVSSLHGLLELISCSLFLSEVVIICLIKSNKNLKYEHLHLDAMSYSVSLTR